MERMFCVLQYMIGKHFSHAILENVDKSLRHNRKASFSNIGVYQSGNLIQ